MKTNIFTKLFLGLAAGLLLAWPAWSLDLLARYPTTLTAGDANGQHARPWEFAAVDIYRVSEFQLQIDDQLKVETHLADLGIGHCTDGAVWAVLLPREPATLTSPQSATPEAVANIWLRFHPAKLDTLFPPNTVFADGNTNLLASMRQVADAKFHSSWHAGPNAMIPDLKDMTVYVTAKDGSRRFFMVDVIAQTAEYAASFNNQSPFSHITADHVPAVVIKTVPEAGSTNVAPGECEVLVTFSKEMRDGSWSWCSVWDDSCPEGVSGPEYAPDHRTCTIRVTLDSGTTYGYWLNTERFLNFRDANGQSAVPYLLTFSTTGQAPTYVERELKRAQAGDYWAKFDLWDGYANGNHGVPTNSAEADRWLGELVKGAYLAKFEPVNGFNPRTPQEMLAEFNRHTDLHSGHNRLGGASFFRTTRQNGKLIGSFLTETPDAFKAAVGNEPNFKLISIEPVTPEIFRAHEASEQESLEIPESTGTNNPI